MRIAYLTAGAAGMYCGSCMHDNTLARAMIARGADCLLVPTYTPIRTDEKDISDDVVFFGGINIFLEQKLPLWGRLPHWLTAWLDRPGLLRLATRKTGSTSPHLLGALTVSMLQGMQGRQRTEVDRLCRWLQTHAVPDAIVLSNFLIGGCVTELKRRLGVPVVVTLQGDDIFLDFLPAKYRAMAIDRMRALAADVDGFIVNSRFYGEKMAALLGLPEEKMHVIPLGIDTTGFLSDDSDAPRDPDADASSPLRIGYLARIDPAKGLHRLVDAMIEFERTRQPSDRAIHLDVAGWLGEQHHAYAAEQWARLDRAGLAGRYTYHGSPDHAGKLDFLRRLDLFCVPTEYEEPKGLYALEAMATRLPVILPRHGVFPELAGENSAVHLVPPGDAAALAEAIRTLAGDAASREKLAERGYRSVVGERTVDRMADQVLQLLNDLADGGKPVDHSAARR
ncbi:glycosyltransferase family 4 protein [Rosistilla oblonga]|uniref:glycosyltransferase family 4 protein n=1 Tax=Rosistilla oblonga TaxID=2527990 RepID=UPI003A96E35C